MGDIIPSITISERTSEMTENFTMNENGNTMNISWNNHKIILETNNSKIEEIKIN